MNVGVIFGGRSAEHDVSIMSARYVTKMVQALGYTPVLMYIDRWGRWWFDAVAERALAEGASIVPEPPMPPAPTELLPAIDRLARTDILFPVLHGPYGEDGTLQGVFEVIGVPYVGSGVTGSAVGMDKAVAKQVFQAVGLPVLPYVVVYLHEIQADPVAVWRRVEADLTYPMFVKPANLGSSVGISKVEDGEALIEAILEAGRYDTKIVVEQGVSAREIEVSVLGNHEPRASVPGEVVPGREWYDYEAKYIDDGTQLLIPAPIDEAIAKAAQEMALRAFRAVDAAGLARVDFLLDREAGTLYINEVNTMPGFTQVSMYPKLWEASGVPGKELVDTLIRLGLERYAERKELASHST